MADRPPGGPENAPPFSIQVSKDTGGCQLRTYGASESSGVSAGLESGIQSGFTGRRGSTLDEVMSRVVRYARAVGNRRLMAEYLARASDLGQVGKVPTPERASKLARCGDWMKFHQYYTEPGCPIRLAALVACCQPLLCQLCALRRSSKLLRRYFPKLLMAIRAGMVPYLLTFTVPSGPVLRDQLKGLRLNLRKMLRDSWRSRKGQLKRYEPASAFAGLVSSLEIKRGEGTRGGGWHVHAHCLGLADGVVDAEAIKRAWCERTGSSVVEAQDVRVLRSVAGNVSDASSESIMESDLAGDLCEVFKYPMKFASLSESDRWHAFGVISGNVQLLNAWGVLRGVQLDGDQADDWEPGDLPYLEAILRFREDLGRYVLDSGAFVGGSGLGLEGGNNG